MDMGMCRTATRFSLTGARLAGSHVWATAPDIRQPEGQGEALLPNLRWMGNQPSIIHVPTEDRGSAGDTPENRQVPNTDEQDGGLGEALHPVP